MGSAHRLHLPKHARAHTQRHGDMAPLTLSRLPPDGVKWPLSPQVDPSRLAHPYFLPPPPPLAAARRGGRDSGGLSRGGEKRSTRTACLSPAGRTARQQLLEVTKEGGRKCSRSQLFSTCTIPRAVPAGALALSSAVKQASQPTYGMEHISCCRARVIARVCRFR